ncbi:hypothetical protein B0H19DRAFT_1113373 [Mycena capillaripes]|nr:hypothetical protein B0H19DRAFT_1113373 [Mycena capillaripes]
MNLNGLHLAFKAAKHHLWSTGFSHFKRVQPTTTLDKTDLDLTPRVQEQRSAYFAANPNVVATFTQNPADQQRRVSAGSTHSSRSTASTHASVLSLFSEQTSSVPTSPSTTASFTDASSRDSSPFPEKSASTISKAGILIDDILGESAIGIVWSGKMILEDGSDDDFSMRIAVKMAVPRDNNDSEGKDDERETIRQEGLVYDVLAKSGKQWITPRYYGVFEDRTGTVALVLDHGGRALKTFKNLSGEQARRLFDKAVEMHSAGVLHDDLVPRNVVEDSEGELRIIDFHIAKTHHRCSGKEKCGELLELSEALGL